MYVTTPNMDGLGSPHVCFRSVSPGYPGKTMKHTWIDTNDTLFISAALGWFYGRSSVEILHVVGDIQVL